ncbi:MAG: hypothetical protein ACFFBD_28925 [Candidatus Hodarchaeota archaeon]
METIGAFLEGLGLQKPTCSPDSGREICTTILRSGYRRMTYQFGAPMSLSLQFARQFFKKVTQNG